MHFIEDFFFLALDTDANAVSESVQLIADFTEGLLALCHIHDHHHVEITGDDGLGYVQDINALLRKIGADFGNDTNRIFAHDRDNDFVHNLSFLKRSAFYKVSSDKSYTRTKGEGSPLFATMMGKSSALYGLSPMVISIRTAS
jgi:hypothetical protein